MKMVGTIIFIIGLFMLPFSCAPDGAGIGIFSLIFVSVGLILFLTGRKEPKTDKQEDTRKMNPNKWRKKTFEDPDVSDDIIAYSPSAVLDQRTNDFCKRIDGHYYTKKSFVFPPYHKDCRTIVVPVTKWDYDKNKPIEIFPAEDIPKDK